MGEIVFIVAYMVDAFPLRFHCLNLIEMARITLFETSRTLPPEVVHQLLLLH